MNISFYMRDIAHLFPRGMKHVLLIYMLDNKNIDGLLVYYIV